MPLYDGEVRMMSERTTLDDLNHTSMGDFLGANADEAFHEWPARRSMEIDELARAQGNAPPIDTGLAEVSTAMLPSSPGGAAVVAGVRTIKRGAEKLFGYDREFSADEIPIAEARQKVKQAGLEGAFKLPDQATMRSDALQIMLDRVRERRQREDAIARGPSFYGVPTVGALATSFLVGAADPLNLASAFIPVVGELRYAKLMASAGETALARAGVRAGVGAAEGAVGLAAIEPIQAFATLQEGRDYHMADALHSLIFGAFLGAGLRTGGGAIGDVLRARAGRPLFPFDAGEHADIFPRYGDVAGSLPEPVALRAEPFGERGAASPSLPEQFPGEVAPRPHAARAQVESDIFDKLRSAGQPAHEAAATSALVAARYAARAQRLGGSQTAMDLYRSEGIDVRGPGAPAAEGRAFDQSKPSDPALVAFGQRVQEVTNKLTTPPFEGKVSISQVFDAYEKAHPDRVVKAMPEDKRLAVFKDRLVKANRDGTLSLYPIGEPTALAANIRDRSKVDTAYGTFHFVGNREKHRSFNQMGRSPDHHVANALTAATELRTQHYPSLPRADQDIVGEFVQAIRGAAAKRELSIENGVVHQGDRFNRKPLAERVRDTAPDAIVEHAWLDADHALQRAAAVIPRLNALKARYPNMAEPIDRAVQAVTEAMAQRGIPAERSFNQAARPDAIGARHDGTAYELPITNAAGKEVGRVQFDIWDRPGHTSVVKVFGAASAEKGKGYGIAAYQKLADFALSTGRELWSDDSVSPEAARVYRALERRGYKVEEITADRAGYGDPNFKVTAAPEKPLFQRGNADIASAKGRITLGSNHAIIQMFAGADRSTMLHEMGHLWLDELTRDAAREGVPQALKDDLGTVLRWLGVTKAEDIGVPQHEQWARGFEQYLMEGKAPSSALARAFDQFKDWLTQIYRSLRNLGTPITDDIRGVMDRMLATDQDLMERLADLPARAQEDLMRGSIARLLDGEPVNAGETLNAAARMDPRIAESWPVDAGTAGRPATPDEAWRALATSREARESLPQTEAPKSVQGIDPASAKPARLAPVEIPEIEIVSHDVRPKAARGPRARPAETWSLLEYLASEGGIDPGDVLIGDVRGAIGTNNKFVPGFGHLIRKGGMRLDDARRAAIDAGYLSDASDRSGGVSDSRVSDLLDAVDQELRGQRVYRRGAEGRERKFDPDEEQFRREQAFDAELAKYDVTPDMVSGEQRARAIEIMRREGERDPIAAYERAVMEDTERVNDSEAGVRIKTEISGWDVPDDARAASGAGRAAAGRQGSEGATAGEGSRSSGEPDRGSAKAGALSPSAKAAVEAEARIAEMYDMAAREGGVSDKDRAALDETLAKIDQEAEAQAQVVRQGAACLMAGFGLGVMG